jgi:biotin transporter BioY
MPGPDLALSLATLLSVAALLPHSAGPYVALVLIGFAVGIAGHLSGSRWLVASGIALIFLGAFLFPLALNLTESTPPQLEPLSK